MEGERSEYRQFRPCFGSKFAYTSIGRPGSLPSPVKDASAPSAAATGIIKRSVLPDSEQLISVLFGASGCAIRLS